jgi:hypothetical protein
MSTSRNSTPRVERRVFTGWQHFVDTVRRPMSPDVDGHSTLERDYDWALGASYADALRMACTGWAEGFKAVSLKADALCQAHGGLELSPRFAEAGDEVDVGMFLSDEPECMVEYPLEPKRKPVVKIVVSASFSAGIGAEEIYNRGAAVLAAIDLLEGSGVRVEVDLDMGTETGRNQFRRTIPLKAADEALDRDKLAFAICHPATLRRLMFRLHEQSGQEGFERMGGTTYGHPLQPEAQDGAIVVPALTMANQGDFRTLEMARVFAQELLDSASAI